MLRYNASAAAFLIRAVLLGNRPRENVGYLILPVPPILKRHFRRRSHSLPENEKAARRQEIDRKRSSRRPERPISLALCNRDV
jgi:hypothetical protein